MVPIILIQFLSASILTLLKSVIDFFMKFFLQLMSLFHFLFNVDSVLHNYTTPLQTLLTPLPLCHLFLPDI